jgi:ABC-type glycerol-3-phosphate transport system permease component
MKLSSLPRLKGYPPYLILMAYSVLILIPLGWMAIASVKPRGELFSKPFSLPSTIVGEVTRAPGTGA